MGSTHKGKPLTGAGFPKTMMGNPTRCVPLIADIDGDGDKELIVGTGRRADDGLGGRRLGDAGIPHAESERRHGDDARAGGPRPGWRPGAHARRRTITGSTFSTCPARMPWRKIDWGMARHDPQNSGWTAAVPQLDPIAAPAEIQPGQRLQVQVTATNPANLPLRWSVGNLPEGAYYDAQTHTSSGKPAADQVFGTYTFSFLVTDGIRQNSRSVSVAVVPDAIYAASMDTDPNWTLDPGWAWGTPTGKGSWNGDPEHRPHGPERPRLRPRRRLRRQPGADPLRHDRPDRLPGLQEHSPELLALAGRRVALRLRLRPGLQRRRELDRSVDDRRFPRLRRRLAVRGVRGPRRRARTARRRSTSAGAWARPTTWSPTPAGTSTTSRSPETRSQIDDLPACTGGARGVCCCAGYNSSSTTMSNIGRA